MKAKLDLDKIRAALLDVQAGQKTRVDIALDHAMGKSSLDRYAEHYRSGRYESLIDIGPLPPARVKKPKSLDKMARIPDAATSAVSEQCDTNSRSSLTKSIFEALRYEKERLIKRIAAIDTLLGEPDS